MNKQTTDPAQLAAPAGSASGAYVNTYGSIYLRIWSLGEGFEMRCVDHGIRIEEAICIRDELTAAISKAARMGTKRQTTNPTHPAPEPKQSP